MIPDTFWKRSLPLFCLALAFAAGVRSASAEESAPETPKPTMAKIDPKAAGLVKTAIDYINNTKSYSTTLTFNVSVDGKQEKTSKYDITVERPNKLALVIKDGDLRCTVLSDGKTLCVYAPPIKKYTVKEAPKTLADIFDIGEMMIVNQDLNNLLFLDQFNMQGAFEKIMAPVLSLKYEGLEEVAGVKAHHLSFSEEKVDWNMWVQDGDQPLLRKAAFQVDAQMKTPEGPHRVKLAFTVLFDDWKVNPTVPSERFVFTPPVDVKKVDSLQEDEYDPKLKGIAAPELKAKLLDGGEFDLASAKGKNVVLLDFWATWCGPCRMALPTVSEVVASYKDKGVVGYAVNLGESIELLKDFKSKSTTPLMPILMDENNKIAEAYRVQPIPMTVIVGKDGIVHQVHMGIPHDMETLKKTLRGELDTLVGGGSLLDKKPDEKKPGDTTPKKTEGGDEDHEKTKTK